VFALFFCMHTNNVPGILIWQRRIMFCIKTNTETDMDMSETHTFFLNLQ